jgi:hypothetical protein
MQSTNTSLNARMLTREQISGGHWQKNEAAEE